MSETDVADYARAMARWEPGTRDRLQQAALELFAEHGYDGVTVKEISDRAGLTERTFFRYFADKREVLFLGNEQFQETFRSAAANCPAGEPLTVVLAGLRGAEALFPDDRRAWARARHEVVSTNLALQERELLKMSSLTVTLAQVLIDRDVDRRSADLAAELGVTLFRATFTAWIAPGERRSFAELLDETLVGMRALLSGPRAVARPCS